MFEAGLTRVTSDRESAARAGDHRALRLWLRLLTCARLVEREVRTRLRRRFGITLPRFDLMAQLERAPDGLKMGELSRRMMVTGGNVTLLVDQLAREGLVERTADRDRRASRVRLTAAGRRAFAQMAREHEAWIVELFARLGERRQTELHEALGALKAACLAAAGTPARRSPPRASGGG